LLLLGSALGVAGFVGPGLIDSALAAGANQAGNREKLKAAYDYIVVGAGAAGCIIASRLAQAGASVLVLEAGEDDEAAGAKVDDPAVWFTNITGALDWAIPPCPPAS
jgi:choline dehydrogenase